MVNALARPATLDELVEIVHGSAKLRTVSTVETEAFRLTRSAAEVDATPLDLGALSGIVEFSPDDQVVVVRSGTTLQMLQLELSQYGHCLPRVPWPAAFPGLKAEEENLANLVGFNLPHTLEAECGSWRDWILGATVVRADGSTAKCGSKAVKNVAGYDFHRFMVGARGTLAVPAEFILRTFPSRTMPKPRLREIGMDHAIPGCAWIQRTLAADFDATSQRTQEHPGIDLPASSTLIRFLPSGTQLARFEDDWVIRSGNGGSNLQIADPTIVRLMNRAKSNFDPQSKLNPGEMGFL